MTGLLASSSLGQSDAFMCGNYGIGGYYGVHPDYNRYDERNFYDVQSGINRISTVMTVLEQPTAGGATVFPYLGIANFPEQGSGVWWYNTRSDAHVDQMTQHMACPVLLGQKWSKPVGKAYSASIKVHGCKVIPEYKVHFLGNRMHTLLIKVG